MNQPRVAVLLATFNGMPHLQEQVASIIAQLNVNVTLFVSDDFSTDGSFEYLTSLANDMFVVLPRVKAGSGARNFYRLICDVDLEEFDYISLADQDDVWAPRKLARAVEKLNIIQGDGYSSDLLSVNEDTRKAWFLSKGDESRPLDYLFQGASAGCTYVLTRKAAILVRDKLRSSIDSLPLESSHDWLIYAICRSHGFIWYLDRQSHIMYRQHAHNAYGALPGFRGVITKFRLISGGWYRKHILWIAQFLKNTDDEVDVLKAIDRLGWSDRLWLASQSRNYRRLGRDRKILALAFLSGYFH